MNKNFKFFSIFVIGVLLLFSLATYFTDINVFGTVKSSDVVESINKNKNSTIECDGDFLRIGKMPTIYKRSLSIFFKYQIIDVGGVYRWTEASDKIDSIYNSFEKTDRQKLGLDK